MAEVSKRYRSVSYFRRLVVDNMHFSRQVPSTTIERTMDLSELMAARNCAEPSPTWSAIFIKAYALVAREQSLVRTSYLKFPWPKLYEHDQSCATLNLDRKFQSERIVLQIQLNAPESSTLSELDRQIHAAQHNPLETISAYRNATRLSRVPWPFRRLIWWLGLNVSGACRARNFGTFGITSLGGQGTGIVHLANLLTSTIHFGVFEESGKLNVRLSFDHRVLDGASAAEVLQAMEQVLRTQMVRECTAGEQLESSSVAKEPLHSKRSDSNESRECWESSRSQYFSS
ncbi:hypothetical protein KIH39_09480 [Telmatocola sphagniphila]|uniref:2-oxoacid dehydrogenase acyltransferase catalytic domain-containing protein n=1 Tax=Telmatocola sphagniphila TaxID=1123043 RepID=A0A8E6EWT2_9BACT|nr:hypothetical protein [Telmatocola sphagniphila]QVL34117.1 hypothetical protein KIH39_09480 [Telmatocola sphagniphila]